MEQRTVKFDDELKIESYRFKGIMQKFPNHFHKYYVIGFIESGLRHLSCKNKEYDITPGTLLLFNPGDNHTCEQINDMALDYRCLNIMPDIMEKTVYEITGRRYKLNFDVNVVYKCELVDTLRELHQFIMDEKKGLRKEESFYFLIEQIIKNYTSEEKKFSSPDDDQIEKACRYMDQNYTEQINLDKLCSITELKRYTLLRNFVKEKGVTPYQYLETIRVNNAKKLLEKGEDIKDISFECGFSDQSHFTRFFKNFIGITPSQYKRIFNEGEGENEK